MDVRQLSALVAVSDHGTFSAAARAMHTVQSNVSTHIARLERELGVELVDRSTGTLTEEGQAAVARTRRIQAELEAISHDIAALRDHVSGLLRFGVIGTTARWLVPKVLEAMSATYPLIRLHIVEATTTSLLPQITNGTLAGAIVNLPVDHPDVVAEQLFHEDRLLMAPRGHPLADHEHVTPEQLAECPLLLTPPGTTFRDEIDAELAPTGVSLQATAEVDGIRLLASLVADGFGASILPATAAHGHENISLVPIDGLTPRSVGLVFNRHIPPSAAIRGVRDLVRNLVEVHGTLVPGVHPAV